MSHTGKIARLPHSLREQLNRRLLDGEPVKSLLAWLNPLPEVQPILAQYFHSRPINHVNVSAWRHSGYADWLAQRDALALTANLQDKFISSDPTIASRLNERLSRLLAIQYAGSAQTFVGCEPNRLARWSRLRQLCADVARLRRTDLYSQRLDLQRDRFAPQKRNTPAIASCRSTEPTSGKMNPTPINADRWLKTLQILSFPLRAVAIGG